MKNDEIRKLLPPETILFDNAAYDNSIIGITFDGRAIYIYEQMIEELMSDENWSYDEASEWIDYNTMRALSYAGNKGPIILYTLEDWR